MARQTIQKNPESRKTTVLWARNHPAFPIPVGRLYRRFTERFLLFLQPRLYKRVLYSLSTPATVAQFPQRWEKLPDKSGGTDNPKDLTQVQGKTGAATAPQSQQHRAQASQTYSGAGLRWQKSSRKPLIFQIIPFRHQKISFKAQLWETEKLKFFCEALMSGY